MSQVRTDMATTAKNDRLNFRLPSDLKQLVAEAAAQLGQSVSDFAVSTLVQTAHQVIQRRALTDLSNRDRDAFIALLDDADAGPNKALTEAADRYRTQVR
jgi:uncharacterized protein (DUF1778 family)